MVLGSSIRASLQCVWQKVRRVVEQGEYSNEWCTHKLLSPSLLIFCRFFSLGKIVIVISKIKIVIEPDLYLAWSKSRLTPCPTKCDICQNWLIGLLVLVLLCHAENLSIFWHAYHHYEHSFEKTDSIRTYNYMFCMFEFHQNLIEMNIYIWTGWQKIACVGVLFRLECWFLSISALFGIFSYYRVRVQKRAFDQALMGVTLLALDVANNLRAAKAKYQFATLISIIISLISHFCSHKGLFIWLVNMPWRQW